MQYVISFAIALVVTTITFIAWDTYQTGCEIPQERAFERTEDSIMSFDKPRKTIGIAMVEQYGRMMCVNDGLSLLPVR